MAARAVSTLLVRRPGLRGLVRLAGGLAAFALIASPLGATAHAQGNGAASADALGASIGEWVTQNQVPAAGLAVMKDGRIVKSFGYGGMDPARPARLASLSKAVTGVCIARLADEGRLSLSAPLGAMLANAFRKFGQPLDPRFKAVTIEQLLMHRGGLAREARRGPAPPDMAGMFRMTLATPLAEQPGGQMSYSNIGYLTLGLVVEAVTGTDYERHCRAAVLAPMKLTGMIDPVLRHRAPNGGWRISANDYAKFIQVFDPGSDLLGPVARKWHESLTGNPSYGFGIGMRRTAQGVMFSHSGKVAAPLSGGAYAVKFPNGWTTVITFDGRLDPGEGTDLRRRLGAVSKL